MRISRTVFDIAGCLALGAVFTACGSDSTGTNGSGSDGTPLSELPGVLAPAVCDTAAQCYGPLLDAVLGGNSCTGLFTKQLEQGEFSLLDGPVAKGTVKYDGTKVSDCVAAIKQRGCAIFSTRLSTFCSSTLQGTVAAGQPCTLNAECTPGLFCKTAACPGVCTSLLAESATCESSDQCQEGFTCDDVSSCQSTPCQKACKKSVGIDVTAAEGDSCDPTTQKLCQSGLVCAAVSVAGGSAVFQCERPATGATCHLAIPDACASGQFCVITPPSLEGTCTPIPKAGEACGKPSPNDKRAICAPGAVCDTAAGKCVAFQDLGGSCTANDQCYSKSCGDAGACVAAKCAN